MDVVVMAYLIFWLCCLIGSIVGIIIVLKQRLKEKKIEDKKHQSYKDY